MRAPMEEMARLAVGGGAEGDRRTRRPRFEEPHTRPAHVVDKTGNFINFKVLTYF